MDKLSNEYLEMRKKALSQFRSGESLTGKNGAFCPDCSDKVKKSDISKGIIRY